MEKKRTLTTREKWNKRKSRGEIKSVLFSDIFKKYLKKSRSKVCLEIGCVPGRFLAYLAKNFGYFPEGIDYVEKTEEITGETLRNNGINDFVLYEADFTKWKIPKQYDLVCSFGFIEHFTGELNEKVIRKHVDLAKPGGTIIIDIPNFNYCQYLFHYVLDRENLSGHNIEIMNLRYFRNLAVRHNLKIAHLGYCGGLFNYWGLSKNANCFQKIIFKLLKGISKFTKKIGFLNNRFFSPFLVFVAKKNG